MATDDVRGVLIVESLRIGGRIADIPLRLQALTRLAAPPDPVNGPPTWTFLEFAAAAHDVEPLARVLEEALDDTLGWYASFRSTDEMFVVFAHRQFRYRLGDPTGKFEAEAYARSIGIPDSQLDWEQ